MVFARDKVAFPHLSRNDGRLRGFAFTLPFQRVTYVVDSLARDIADVGVGVGFRRGRQPDTYPAGGRGGGADLQSAAGTQGRLAAPSREDFNQPDR